jgi:hypothetical protein
MPATARRLLNELESIRLEFGPEAARRRLPLLRAVGRARCLSAADVLRLHEVLCFCRAYPDNEAVLAVAERLLAGFARRPDLQQYAGELADSGVAGTAINYRFYATMARWAAARWPERLRIDWAESDAAKVEGVLPLLASYSETPALDELGLEAAAWLAQLKGPREADGAFLVRRLGELRLGEPGLAGFAHEYLYEQLDLWMVLEAGPGGPSRTAAHWKRAPVAYRLAAPEGRRPDLQRELERAPLSVEKASPAAGRQLVDLAREAMITRSRDLDAFAWADARDVTLIDDGDGLMFVLIGMVPERRLMFESVYGYLILRNGVPVGYGVVSSLYGSIEVAFNLFETFRGAEAGHLYARLLAGLLRMFTADTFTVYPYQLGGDGNDEGLRTGAWWFYQKLGFRSRDRAILRLMRAELALMKRRPGHRSRPAVLRQLVEGNVYLDLGELREDIIGRLALAEVGLKVSTYLAKRFGSDRHLAGPTCAREARARLGEPARAPRGAGEKLAWERWAPVVLLLPGVERWTRAEKKALAAVIRAKGGRSESAFVARFDAHRRLRAALVRLARG